MAARHYERAGYVVLDRNWRVRAGEIDLVVAKPGIVVFVEVKARATDRFGGAAAAVGTAKQRRLRVLAAQWLAAHRPSERVDVRFDVAAITGTRIALIEAAF